MRGIRVDNKIKQWALVLLARTSKRVYMEVAKVLKLPNVSYIYRLSNQIVSRNHSRGYSLCFQTIHTMKKRAIAEGWSPNAKIVVNAIDSASSAMGIQWDNSRNMMVGQDASSKFQPLHRKFREMAGRSSAAASGNNDVSIVYYFSLSQLNFTPLQLEHQQYPQYIGADSSCQGASRLQEHEC